MNCTTICSSKLNCRYVRLHKGRGIPNICFFPVLVNKCRCHLHVRCVSPQACMCVSFGVNSVPAPGTSVLDRMCECGCGLVYACVRLCCLSAGQAAVGTRHIRQDGVVACTRLSSLYSNDKPCCFTCHDGRSAM